MWTDSLELLVKLLEKVVDAELLVMLLERERERLVAKLKKSLAPILPRRPDDDDDDEIGEDLDDEGCT